MALINCPKCGGKVSNLASSCPHCGLALDKFQELINNDVDVEQAIYEANVFSKYLAAGRLSVVVSPAGNIYGGKYYDNVLSKENVLFDGPPYMELKEICSGDNAKFLLYKSGSVSMLTNAYTDANYPELIKNWRGIKSIAMGTDQMLGVTESNTVACAGIDWYGACSPTQEWKNIIAVAAGPHHSVGLTADGHVLVAGECTEDQNCVWGWENIVAVAAGRYHTVGLQKDGKVLAVGYKTSYSNIDEHEYAQELQRQGIEEMLHPQSMSKYMQWSISHEDKYSVCLPWDDIISIAAGKEHTVGLKKDGTVVALGRNKYGQCNVSEWKDIMAIAAGDDMTMAVDRTGNIFIVGQCANKDDFNGVNIFNSEEVK